MGKKGTKQDVAKTGTVQAAPSNRIKETLGPLNWPAFSVKKDLEVDWLLEDQIALLRNFLTAKECASFVSLFSTQSLLPSPPAKKGEAQRTNERMSASDPEFAKKLFESSGLENVTRDWPSVDVKMEKRPVGLNPNLRIYRYGPSQLFNCHYDDSVTDPSTGFKSEWTLLIYLTGIEDGIQDGETVFYLDHNKKKPVVAPLERGTALLHRHGRVCMLHEARPPTKGEKWVLRSDLMFG